MRTLKSIFLSTSLLTASLLTVTACKDSEFLEVTPRSQGDSQIALTTPEGIDAAVNGIYDRLQSTALYGRDLLALSEALSDNSQFTNKSGRLVNENRNVASASFTNWATSYFAINQANLVLDNIGSVAFADTSQRNRLQGQAYFLRALFYHDLSRIYAYIRALPMYTSRFTLTCKAPSLPLTVRTQMRRPTVTGRPLRHFSRELPCTTRTTQRR
jgi:hypothetical protein